MLSGDFNECASSFIIQWPTERLCRLSAGFSEVFVDLPHGFPMLHQVCVGNSRMKT